MKDELAQLERDVESWRKTLRRHETELLDAEAAVRRSRQHLSAAEGRLANRRGTSVAQPNT